MYTLLTTKLVMVVNKAHIKRMVRILLMTLLICSCMYTLLTTKLVMVVNKAHIKRMVRILLMTLLHCITITYFTLVGVVSSDVSRSSCTTSFTPCCSIFSQSYVFFQGCPCPLLDVIDVLHPGAPPSSFHRHHSENACLY